MGSKQQRRKERHTRRRNEKRKQQEQTQGRRAGTGREIEIVVGSNARHRERLAQQIPHAWSGEAAEDVALFDAAVLSTLPPELREQAGAVREALLDTLESRPDDALKRVAMIPRGSPFSEWRLFIRGLIDWLAGEQDGASEAWKRLDRERRPGRIATSMMVALRSDLDRLAPQPGPPPLGESIAESPASSWDWFDEQQLYHAKVLRRARFDRAALQVAESGVTSPDESHELLIGPRKIHWLRRFIDEYADTEPDLAAALVQTALGRAYSQNFSNLFDEAARVLPGPRHDPRNLLFTFFFYSQFNDDAMSEAKATKSLDDYLKRDLPGNAAVPVPLRKALVSQIHLNEAMSLILPASQTPLAWLFQPQANTKSIRSHFTAAVKAAPDNAMAYKAYVNWINDKLESDQLEKKERTQFEKELAEVMGTWSRNLPNEVTPRLWLVDFLLENERIEEARPHVEFLATARHEDPRVKATPWKWQLLDAMRLCRRKAWLAEVPARLDAAEAAWPTWMSKAWLPYLRAALALREGKLEEFETQRERIRGDSGRTHDSLADACMMLGAAQMMRIAAVELKPLRTALDRALKAINSMSLEDLLETGSFFCDIHRVKLVYPAYRKHGKIIGQTLFGRLKNADKLVLERIEEERIQKAVLWGSECRFWSANYATRLPDFFSNPDIERHPVFVAAKLNAVIKETYLWNIGKVRGLGKTLREAALSQRDAYYRFWFVELANRLDDLLSEADATFSRLPFGGMPGFADDVDEGDIDDDGEDDDLSLGFDPDCNCPKCQAARMASEGAAATGSAASKQRKSR